jgi:hypothetical protein
MVKKIIKTVPIIGPKKGMILRRAQTSAIVTAFGIPNIGRTRV